MWSMWSMSPSFELRTSNFELQTSNFNGDAVLLQPFRYTLPLNMVKMKACKNATSNSSVIINRVSGIEATAPATEPPTLSPAFPKIKIRLTKAQDHNVAGRDVGEKTQQQRKRLEEKPEHFDWCQDKYFKRSRHTGHPKRMFPEVFVGAECRDQEGEQCQYDGHGNIAGDVGAAGKKGIWPIRLRPK
jgi:hypothetical protein